MPADIHRCGRADVVLWSGSGDGFHIVVKADDEELLHVQADRYSWLLDPEGSSRPPVGDQAPEEPPPSTEDVPGEDAPTVAGD